jgi:hypothetical protein
MVIRTRVSTDTRYVDEPTDAGHGRSCDVHGALSVDSLEGRPASLDVVADVLTTASAPFTAGPTDASFHTSA